MPAKKRLVPPIRPNADGTGFVRAGRPGAPARNRSGGPRRAAEPSNGSDDASLGASADTRASSAEAAAPTTTTSATAPPRGRLGQFAALQNTSSTAKVTSIPTIVTQNKEKGDEATEVKAVAPTQKALPQQQRMGGILPSQASKVTTSSPTPAAHPGAPLYVAELGLNTSLGVSECLVPSRTLHQLGLASGSLVQLSTSYGEVYAEARQMRGTAASDKLFVNDDMAAVLVDKSARLSPVPVPAHGLPVLTSLTLKPVAPEELNGSASPPSVGGAGHINGNTSSVSASLAATLDWQAMFRRALHHKVAYMHLRTTQRVLTQRLTLEVVQLTTSHDDSLAETATSPVVAPTWGVVTDATSLYLESGDRTVAEVPAADAAVVAPVSEVDALCTLVVGESGTGKTHWLQQLCHSQQQTPCSPPPPFAGRHVEWARVEELPQGEGSEVSTATALHETFARARQSAPAVVVIDDLHLICAREASSAGSRWAMSLIAHALAEELLDLQQHQQQCDVRVVASAPSLDSLDSCLTGASLFGRHVVALTAPDGPAERVACLRACLTEVSGATALQSVGEKCVSEVAEHTHGFTQRDIHRLAETAVVKAFEARQSVVPQDADLRAAAAAVRPSSLKRFEVSVPNVTWDDIGGSAEAKQTLCDVVEWCLGKQSWLFSEFNLTPPKGVLLYGPPGCSKTMLAKALANESHMNFISIKGPEVFSKWVGDSEKAVRDIFERARAASPCVVFIDELDGMCGHRGRGGVSDRVISQFLTELDGLPAAFAERKNALVFVAATNRPDSIDGAVLRPGRIDRRVYVGLPSYAERVAITEIQFRHIPVAAQLTAAYVAERTEGYTGAEVVAVVKEAAFHAITADAAAVCVALADVDAALLKVRPRIQAKDVEWYKQWPHNTASTTPVE